MEYKDYVPGGDDAEGYGQEGYSGGAYAEAVEVNTRARVGRFVMLDGFLLGIFFSLHSSFLHFDGWIAGWVFTLNSSFICSCTVHLKCQKIK